MTSPCAVFLDHVHTLQVPAMYLCKSPVLTAFANGRSTALVIEGGASSMSVSPVYDGFVLSGHVKHSQVAGNALTKYFRQLLEVRHQVLISPVHRTKAYAVQV
jgi:actin-related protein